MRPRTPPCRRPRWPRRTRRTRGRSSVPVRLARRKGPFLERAGAAILGELDDPQVAPASPLLVVDFDTHDGSGPVDRDDLAAHLEALVGAVALLLPHRRDCAEPDERLGPGREQV